MVEDGSAFGDLGYGKLAYRLNFLPILVELEVFGDLRVLPLELLELLVRHGGVEAALPQLGQHVTAGDLALVLDGFGERSNRLRLGPTVGAIASC